MASKFKNDQGVRYVKSLFYEMAGADKTNVLYTLKEFEHEGYPSIHQLYLTISDPTEYQFAITCFESVDHWEKVSQSEWFQDTLNKMRHSLELKIKSTALVQLLNDSVSDSKTRTASAKFILEKGYNLASPNKRRAGRPSKQEIAEAANRQILTTAELEDDYNRIQGLR